MKFRASEMGRVVKCPGSKVAEAKRPHRGTCAATEGTAAAKLAEMCLRGQKNPAEFIGQEIKGILVDAEMVHYIDTYISYLGHIYFKDGGIESPLACLWATDDLTGTPDFWSYDSDTNTLHVVDLKYGFGWVHARHNWQLVAYATLLSETHKHPRASVHLHIFQPRANKPGGPADVWCLNAGQFVEQQTIMARAMARAQADPPPCEAGDHCRYCRAITECQTNANTAGHCLDVAGAGETGALEGGDIAIQLSRIEVAAKRLEHRRVALEAQGLEMAKQGVIIPGYGAKQAYGRLAWAVDAITAGDEMGVDLRAPAMAVTPTQAKTQKLIPDEMLPFLTVRKPGEFKLKCVDMDAVRETIANG